jgi:hypothetical protein
MLTYEFSKLIPRPIEKVFAWCTDYQPDDIRFHSTWARSRTVVERTKDQVVIVSEAKDGTKRVVTVKLQPPDRWEAFTNDLHIIYTLTKVEHGTKFTFKGELSDSSSKKGLERLRLAEQTWDRIVAALENEVSPQ